MVSRVRWLTALVAVLLLASLWYIQAPPRSVDAFEQRVAHTAEGLRSQVESARIWAKAVEDGHATRPAASIGVAEADADAAELASDFAELQPPRGTDRLRDALLRLARMATDALGAARIAADRGSWARVAALTSRLDGLSSRLDQLGERLGS